MVRLRFETDLGTTLKASQDFAKAVEKVGDSAKGSTREMNALAAAAKRITDQNLTPQEKYNQKLETMAKAVKAGSLSMVDAERNAARLRQKLDETTRSGDKAFGVEAIANLASYAKGFLGLSAVVSGVSATFRKMEADAQQSADRVLSSIGAIGELQQVATSAEDFQKLLGQSRALQRSGVFGPDQGAQASDLVFAMRNAVYSDSEVAFITKLGESKQVKPENMQKVAEGLKKAQDVFGKAEAGSIEQVANKVFAAANAMQTDFAAASVATTLFGSESKSLGFSDEEALAAFVAVEKQSPGAEEAATRMRSLFTQIQKDKLGKGTLTETIASLKTRMDKGESAIDITGEIRASAGLNILAGAEGQAVFNQMLPEITAGNTQDIIGGRQFIESDPRASATVRRQTAEGQLAEAQSALTAEKEALYDAFVAERKESFVARGETKLATLAGWAYAPSDLAGTERQMMQSSLPFVGLSPELRSSIEDYLRRSAVGIEKMIQDLEAPKPHGRAEQ